MAGSFYVDEFFWQPSILVIDSEEQYIEQAVTFAFEGDYPMDYESSYQITILTLARTFPAE